jgi:hypothetical protein
MAESQSARSQGNDGEFFLPTSQPCRFDQSATQIPAHPESRECAATAFYAKDQDHLGLLTVEKRQL